MFHFNHNQPIAIFDSGIGGLTVAKEVTQCLPEESVIYFGDTAHLPYGDKSASTIQGYTKKIVDFLLANNVKLILIACNSASAAAYEMLQEYVGDRAILLNVIDPAVDFLVTNYTTKRVGLIGTKITVESQNYQKKLASLARHMNFKALATPLLVPIIEQGYFEHELIEVALKEYLNHPLLQNIDALVLGCTHYPIIQKSISKFYQNKVDIIDASKIAAQAVKNALASRNLFASIKPKHHFYVTDLTPGFTKGAQLFFGADIHLQLKNIF